MLRLFVDKLASEDKYSLLNRDNLREPIQMLLSQKQKSTSNFSCAFLKFILNFKRFQKKVTLIVDIFPKLRTPKDVVR